MTYKIGIVYLPTGLCLLGKIVHQDDQGITMTDTLELRFVPVGAQVGEIIMGNEIFFDKNLEISKSQYLCLVTEEDIEDTIIFRYEKSISSLRAQKSGIHIA